MQYPFAFQNTSDPQAHQPIVDPSVPSDFYRSHHHHNNHQPSFEVNNGPLFNVHELWAISLATILFIVGFPSNLISIVVCLRSLIKKPTIGRQRFFATNNHNNSQKNGAPTYYRGIYKAKMNRNQANNRLVEDPQVTMSLFSQEKDKNNFQQNGADKYEPLLNNSNFNNNSIKSGSLSLSQRRAPTRCRLLINLKTNTAEKRKDSTVKSPVANGGGGFAGVKLARNPHRHCFELYLIEICFCDLFILTYFFAECVLLVLSRYKLIDSIYAETILISKFMCQFSIGFNRTLVLMHNWLVSSLALTRCYAIYKPLNSTANFGSKFYLRLNLFVLFTLILVFSTLNILGVMPLEYKRYNANETSALRSLLGNDSSIAIPHAECSISKSLYARFKHIEVFINVTLGVIGYSLPCIITLIINLILIYNIRNINMFRSSQNKQQLTTTPSLSPFQNGGGSMNLSSCGGGGGSLVYSSGSRQYFKSRNQFVKTTSSLLTLSFSYLICYIPYTLLFLLLSLDLLHMNGNLIFAFYCLRYLNHTLNFFIYFATGKRFRNDVIAFLGFKN